jgi:DUF971 family protein
MIIQPTLLHLKEAEKQLVITWSDGHSFSYSLRYLRGWCPCAHCQGHFAAQKQFIANANHSLRTVEPVGNYAITPIWADNHRSGLYTYTYLLALEKSPPSPGPTNDECTLK